MERLRLARCIMFEERDGSYWLSGADLKLATSLLSLATDAERVGFDSQTVTIYFKILSQKRIRLACRRGEVLSIVQVRGDNSHPYPESCPVWLAPEAFADRLELELVKARAERKGSTLRWRVEEMKRILSAERDVAPLYVLQVTADWYEVDWELSSCSD